ncbi:endonuclease/exonuclease/phosphatase family protein [Marinimicrobium agarilyticum]|uniref:endonuclease/exonuclease/phosphatase family protein n=1 Tax=Marinimicrobium agarilyticum TaxID=306546 RepID=UPI0004098415|nr:endonuclease/exonuclease/phosphatase family protein [Marinimicrobium agarilyticum]
MLTGLWVAVVLLLLLTLIPLSRIEAWWVRGLDFPRLQLSCLALVLVGALLCLLDWGQLSTWILLTLSSACLAYHAWWIVPYTPLHSKEVRSAGTLSEKDRQQRIAIMTANVLTPNRNAERLLAIVAENRPDILVTLESDDWWQEQLDVLEQDYPHTIKCPQDNLYGMHVYSRYPLENAALQFLVEEDVPSIHAEAVLPSGRRVVLHFLHPAPPSPSENATSSERDAELVMVGRSVAESERDVPTIVTGDLNDVAWSLTTRLFRKVSGLLDPRIGRGMFNSFHADYPFIRWPLDHLFHSEHFVLEDMQRLPSFGSDHFPVLVRLVYRERAKPQEGIDADAEDRALAREKMADEAVGPGEVHRPEMPASRYSLEPVI